MWWLVPIIPPLLEAEMGGLLDTRSYETSLDNIARPPFLQKNLKISHMWWFIPVVLATQEAEVGGPGSGSCL